MTDFSATDHLTRNSVLEAHEIIKPHIQRTPVLRSDIFDRLASTPKDAVHLGGTDLPNHSLASPKLRLWFKCENLQRTGAFKVRGAFHAIEKLKRDPTWVRERGVITQSSGNHAQALALAAKLNQIPAYIVMPDNAPTYKVAATRAHGAHILPGGQSVSECDETFRRTVNKTGARFIPPGDHADIVVGQGTIGLEMQEQVREIMETTPAYSDCHKNGLDAVIMPCGGGGMLSGVALSYEGSSTRMFGAVPAFPGNDSGKRGFEHGVRETVANTQTIADGLRCTIGDIPWDIMYGRQMVTAIYQVSEDDIAAATSMVFNHFRFIIEPSAAVALAAVLFNEEFRSMVEREAGEEGWDVGIVLSGGNISVDRLEEIIQLLEQPVKSSAKGNVLLKLS